MGIEEGGGGDRRSFRAERSSASRDPGKNVEDDVLFGESEDRTRGREYRKSNWTAAEMLILQTARRVDFDKLVKGGPKAKKRTAVERWQSIEDYCWGKGVRKSAQQCQDKWELLAAEFTKVTDYERRISNEERSYWVMLGDERKKHRLPRNFFREVYQALAEWYHRSKAFDQSDFAADMPTPTPPFQQGEELSPADIMEQNDRHTEFSGSEEGNNAEEHPAENGSVKPTNQRKRKQSHKPSARVKSERMNATPEGTHHSMMDALFESENRKDKRHKEDMEMETLKLRFEKERFRGIMDLSAGYIGALNSVGEGLKRVSAALQAKRP